MLQIRIDLNEIPLKVFDILLAILTFSEKVSFLSHSNQIKAIKSSHKGSFRSIIDFLRGSASDFVVTKPLNLKSSLFPSAQSHSSVERAGLLGGVQLRLVQPDETNRLRGEALEQAIKADIEAGLIPFYVSL